MYPNHTVAELVLTARAFQELIPTAVDDNLNYAGHMLVQQSGVAVRMAWFYQARQRLFLPMSNNGTILGMSPGGYFLAGAINNTFAYWKQVAPEPAYMTQMFQRLLPSGCRLTSINSNGDFVGIQGVFFVVVVALC